MTNWEDANMANYSAESTTINGRTVTVCLDDEGPITPAFYWDIRNLDGVKVTDGWARSVKRAKQDAVRLAQRIS